MNEPPLASRLVGSWELLSRIDRTASGQTREEPSLGSDPIAFLVFDAKGHFAAQFMKRDREGASSLSASAAPTLNNSRARGGYDAYFGTFTVDEAKGLVETHLVAALSQEDVGARLMRAMRVEGDTLTLELDTTAPSGEAVRRTLIWRRVG
jgi:hypothetical protein